MKDEGADTQRSKARTTAASVMISFTEAAVVRWLSLSALSRLSQFVSPTTGALANCLRRSSGGVGRAGSPCAVVEEPEGR